MPPEDRALFQRLMNVSRETMARLDCYEDLLRKRCETLSLVGKSTLPDVWSRHFLDSAQLLNHIDQTRSLLDIGSGAGFPGMVLAMCGHHHVTLCENNQKKSAFLRDVATETGTSVSVCNQKAEALHDRTGIGIVTARAVASLENLLYLGAPFFQKGAEAWFMKGKTHAAEIETARRSWEFDVSIIPSITSNDSCLLHLSGIRAKT